MLLGVQLADNMSANRGNYDDRRLILRSRRHCHWRSEVSKGQLQIEWGASWRLLSSDIEALTLAQPPAERYWGLLTTDDPFPAPHKVHRKDVEAMNRLGNKIPARR
jgi:hypothetical protein